MKHTDGLRKNDPKLKLGSYTHCVFGFMSRICYIFRDIKGVFGRLSSS